MSADVGARVQGIDVSALEGDLEAHGWSVLRDLLTSTECDDLASLYTQDTGFRSRVVMARHSFGKGEYRYFSYPLPPLVERLRTALYPCLAPVANRWHERMGMTERFPAEHAEFIARCAAAGQSRPTPLLLQYGAGDYNCLHQDLYGEHVFPLQLAVLLCDPATDFSGGEFVLTEQRPRMQTRVAVVPLTKGDGVVFAVNSRPVRGTRGDYRVKLRHGVSKITEGHRHTLGIIFHDAS
ncbi:MAG: 2OG-Fe(II) oxygenase [Caldimonas sp.]